LSLKAPGKSYGLIRTESPLWVDAVEKLAISPICLGETGGLTQLA